MADVLPAVLGLLAWAAVGVGVYTGVDYLVWRFWVEPASVSRDTDPGPGPDPDPVDLRAGADSYCHGHGVPVAVAWALRGPCCTVCGLPVAGAVASGAGGAVVPRAAVLGRVRRESGSVK